MKPRRFRTVPVKVTAILLYEVSTFRYCTCEGDSSSCFMKSRRFGTVPVKVTAIITLWRLDVSVLYLWRWQQFLLYEASTFRYCTCKGDSNFTLWRLDVSVLYLWRWQQFFLYEDSTFRYCTFIGCSKQFCRTESHTWPAGFLCLPFSFFFKLGHTSSLIWYSNIFLTQKTQQLRMLLSELTPRFARQVIYWKLEVRWTVSCLILIAVW